MAGLLNMSRLWLSNFCLLLCFEMFKNFWKIGLGDGYCKIYYGG